MGAKPNAEQFAGIYDPDRDETTFPFCGHVVFGSPADCRICSAHRESAAKVARFVSGFGGRRTGLVPT